MKNISNYQNFMIAVAKNFLNTTDDDAVPMNLSYLMRENGISYWFGTALLKTPGLKRRGSKYTCTREAYGRLLVLSTDLEELRAFHKVSYNLAKTRTANRKKQQTDNVATEDKTNRLLEPVGTVGIASSSFVEFTKGAVILDDIASQTSIHMALEGKIDEVRPVPVFTPEEEYYPQDTIAAMSALSYSIEEEKEVQSITFIAKVISWFKNLCK